ncbi:MAG: bis(5'-nucleosyl)-tetraphosphatase (symmetrical) YqeK [Lachnospiraceae bacterium]|nr:bis(5'-nucleosyl)-tetraphosphatase (symmetrical) YqeK [Lachnospiraceae bacterium]
MKKIKKYLKKHLVKERYRHTLGVSYIAVAMAMRYNPDPGNSDFMKRAETAGLLHDCAKSMDNDKKLQICEKNHIPYSSFEASHPYLLHGKVGAYIAKTKFGIEDEDILQAITWHTTGRPNMSLLEKIIFIADYIEPSRNPIPELDVIRQLAFIDIDKAMEKILSNTLKFLESKGNPIDQMTQTTYDSYVHCPEKRDYSTYKGGNFA